MKKEKAVEVKALAPGVIASILEIIKTRGPIKKEAILNELAMRFPDRAKEGMAKTVQVQISGKGETPMEREKKVKFVINDKGEFSISSKSLPKK